MQEDMRLRPDFERVRKARGETRSADRLRYHFEVELGLARELAQSSRADRAHLYSDVYRRLFDTVPDHPQHRGQRANWQQRIQAQATMLRRWLGPHATYVEIGCGDAAPTKVIANHVQTAIGVDVTSALVTGAAPAAFRFVQSDGVNLSIPDDTVDLVFSNQLMEHLHIEDATFQLREIYRILKPGGSYLCCTPNRLTGPHDISAYFGYEPAGLHLREYDHRSLGRLFRSVGFRRVVAMAMAMAKGRILNVPTRITEAAESLVEALPRRPRARMLGHPAMASLAGVNLIGIK